MFARALGLAQSKGRAWVPHGTRIGWIMGSELFLEPTASNEVAQLAAGSEPLGASAQTLRHRLREHGLLASVDAGRQMLLVRRTLGGRPRQVIYMPTGNAASERLLPQPPWISWAGLG